MELIYTLLKLNKRISIETFKRLKELKGLVCYIKKPVEKTSIFGLEDIVEYDEAVKYQDKLLLFNIFQEASQGMMEYDTFIDAYALTLFTERLPLQTSIEVDFCGRTMTFKVDDHKNVSPSVCEQLFIKNMLVPAT